MDGRIRRWRLRIGACLCAAALALGAGACEKTPEQKLRRAKVLLTKDQNTQAAKEKLEAVLKAEPENLEAKRLMAKYYRLEGDWKRAEQQLDKLWEKYEFDDEDQQMSGRLRNARELIRSEYVALYRSWADSIEANREPKRYVGILEKGLRFSKNDTNLDLSMKLAKFYWKRGQDLVEKDKKKEAAETFSKIRELRTIRGWEKREKAKKKARELRLEFFKEKARKRFEEEAKPLIAEFDGFELDEPGERIRIDLTQNVDRKLDPDKSEDRKKAKKMAFVGLIDKLRRIALTIANLAKDTDLRKIGTDRAQKILLRELDFEREEMTFRRGRYEIRATLPVEGAIRMAYDVKSAYQQVQAEQKEKGGDAGAGGDASTDAGARETAP